MTAYACDSCKMSIEAPVCGNCHQELIHKSIDAKSRPNAVAMIWRLKKALVNKGYAKIRK